jgi:predicted kinase
MTPPRTNKLYVMVGLPGSGKTTWAERAQCDSTGAIVIVSRDDLREKLFRAEGVLSRGHENYVTAIESYAVIQALASGFDVIVDSTNLRPEYVQRWRDVAEMCKVRMTLVKMTASVKTCIERDAARGASGGRYVGEAVIRRMAERIDRDRDEI